MAQRLVTQSDLEKYPELRYKGVSRNQHFDFDTLEANASKPSDEEIMQKFVSQRKSIPIGEEPKTEIKNPILERNEPKPEPKKEVPKKTAKKNKK